ncbi:YisB protein [Xylariales sp. AK1849]|nr:YisB protein [Xylariales sp. AK1849]
MLPEDQRKNYELLRESLSTVLIEKATKSEAKPRRRAKSKKPSKPATPDDYPKDTEDLADFVEYIAADTFECLPDELKALEYYVYAKDADLQTRYALPLTGEDIATLMPSLEPSVSESLLTYGITDEDKQGVNEFLAPVLTAFLTSISTPPPAPITTKGKVTACELCDRDWINLTYHHLIPRFVHAKVLKRGWHRVEDLQSVAWLCAACHRFVHQFASHEDLARNFYTVDLLLEQEEVVQFAKWVGKLRWKGR